MSEEIYLNQDRTVVLFDMDGTLTLPRKKIANSMIANLELVSTQARIGIVSGSPMGYIRQQLSSLWGLNRVNPNKILLMPCNGTQAYRWSQSSNDFIKFYHTDFRDKLLELFGNKAEANKKYAGLVRDVLELQTELLEEFSDLEISGNFFSYRESLINWSMIGRDASDDQRTKFEVLDGDYKIRKRLHEALRVRLDTSGLDAVECALGGATSIDIYPQGWDKTHCLQHMPEADVWFWGDRCEPGGNDYSLYSLLRPQGQSFAVSNPQACINSVRENLPIDWDGADLVVGNLEIKVTVGSD